MDIRRVVAGRYRLIAVLGRGGMSTVWHARDLVLDREVAIKILTTVGDGMSRDAIRAEALAVGGLAHPHITTVFDYGEADVGAGRPVPYIVMELLRGRPLAALTQPATTELALRIAAQVADALATAHDHGIVHRDVKPGNVMLTPAGAKVFDFGLAAHTGDIEGAESHDVVLGTPAYSAPERLVGAAVTPAADLYALGVLLHRLVTGALPWRGSTAAEVMAARAETEPTDLPDEIPPEVQGLYRRCLDREPARRPTAREMASALAAAVGMAAPVSDEGLGEPEADLPPGELTDEVLAPALPRVRLRRPVLAAVIAVPVLAVALIALTVSQLLPSGSSEFVLPVAAGRPATTQPALPGPTAVPTGAPAPTGAPPVAHPTSTAPGPVVEPGTGHPAPVPAPLPSPTTAGGQTTFSSAAGTIVATCVGTQAELLSWAPAAGFSVKQVAPGPASEAVARFRSQNADWRMTVTCSAGTPTVSVTSEGHGGDG